MKHHIMVKSPDGEKIELVSGEDANFCEGALQAAQSLLELLQDDMDLEDGYSIEKVSEPPDMNRSDTSFAQLFD